MNARRLASVYLALPALLVLGACSEEDPVLTQPSAASRPAELPRLASVVTCSTVTCIEDFLWNTCGTLDILDRANPYVLADHYLADACSPGNHIMIYGQSPGARPELNITGQFTYYPNQTHAALHLVENTSRTDVLEDLIIRTAGYMDGAGNVAGIQVEATNIDIRNVLFESLGNQSTVHFLGVLDLLVDDIVLDDQVEFVFGDEDWCGDPGNCGGPGPAIYANGSTIENSELHGTLRFDVQTSLSNTLIVRNNDPLTSLDLNVDQTGSGTVAVDLEDNTFASGPGARVLIKGDYTVNASGNVTSKGPCEADALSDFDTSGATQGSSALNLASWIHDGVTYTSDQIVITNINVVTDPFACTKTITWTTNYPSSSKVYYGSNCASLNQTATGGGNTTNHSVVIDLTTLPVGKFGYKVESENTCYTAQSSCTSEKRDPCISM